MNNTKACQSFATLQHRLDGVEQKISPDSESGPLSAYPNGWIAIAEVFPYLSFEDMDALKNACSDGFFKAGTELKILSPAGAKKPVYRINMRAFFNRILSN